MSAFVSVKTYRRDVDVVVDAIVNVDRIVMAWDAGCRDDASHECSYLLEGRGLERAAEPYESLVAKILAASTAKDKENVPPAPPTREKETLCSTAVRTRVREGFRKPTVAEVAAHIAEKGYTFDAEEFWNFYESKGWRVGTQAMRSWTSACVTWQKIEDRRARREAHIDAKMDERERKRERRAGGRRKADNNVEMSDEVREEVRRDFAL